MYDLEDFVFNVADKAIDVLRAHKIKVAAAALAIFLIPNTLNLFSPREAASTTMEDSEESIEEIQETPRLTINRYYTVQSGDWLSVLAERANCTKQEIQDLNGMDDTNIQLNADIVIPYHINPDEISEYTTQIPYTNENLEEIATAYDTDVESIYQLNPENIFEDGENYYIIGDSLNVPTFKDYQYGNQKTK